MTPGATEETLDEAIHALGQALDRADRACRHATGKALSPHFKALSFSILLAEWHATHGDRGTRVT